MDALFNKLNEWLNRLISWIPEEQRLKIFYAALGGMGIGVGAISVFQIVHPS